MQDHFNREIHYLRISVIESCNLRCTYCVPDGAEPVTDPKNQLSIAEIVSVCRAATELGFDKFRLTGGEPLVRRDLPQLIAEMRKIPGVKFIGLTTNGLLLAPLARSLKESGLDSVNVSLDTLDPARYSELTRGGNIEDVFKGIDAAAACGFPIKINVVMSGEESLAGLPALEKYAQEKGARVQTIKQYDLRQNKTDDHPFSRPLPCEQCNRVRLMADGTLRPCLHSTRSVLLDKKDPKASLKAVVLLKPERGTTSDLGSVRATGG